MLSNNKSIQQADLAGKTKLTMVSIGLDRVRHTFFIPLYHDVQGKAILPSATLNQILSGVPRGTTITTG